MLDQERQTSSLGRTPWITSFHLSERKLFSSPLDLLLFLLCNSGTGPSPLSSANCFSGGGISDIWLSWTWAVVLPFYKEYFVMLKESWMFDMVSAFKNHVIFYCWFFFFSLYLHVFILSSKMWSKKEAALSSDTVWPDNFFPPFLNAEMRQKLFGFNAVLRRSHLITWQCCFQLNQMIVLKCGRQCCVGMLDFT